MNEKYISLQIPIQVISEANTHEHWRKSHLRHKNQKYAVRISLLSSRVIQKLPVTITMTRLSHRFLDSDNLQMAFKYVRDAIAEHFITDKAPGRADDHPGFVWNYDQKKSKEKGIELSFHWDNQ